jgi:hypothetical protein
MTQSLLNSPKNLISKFQPSNFANPVYECMYNDTNGPLMTSEEKTGLLQTDKLSKSPGAASDGADST